MLQIMHKPSFVRFGCSLLFNLAAQDFEQNLGFLVGDSQVEHEFITNKVIPSQDILSNL